MKEFFREIPYLTGSRLVLRKITQEDAEGLRALVSSEITYRYLPTFLYEKKYEDIGYVISHLYDECLQDSLILGIFKDNDFCGLGEFYGLRKDIHKISVGYRLLPEYWGKGIASETLGIMLKYLNENTGIEIITASTLPDNQASAHVLMKNGFTLVVSGSDEDWGYEKPLPTDKWIL